LLIHSNYRAKRQADPGRTPKASTPAVIVHPVLGLDVPNDRLDRGAAAHLAADRGGDAAHLAADSDAELLGVIVAAIAFVDVDAAGLDPGQRFQLGDDRSQGVAIGPSSRVSSLEEGGFERAVPGDV
jgi:hypothetical protein